VVAVECLDLEAGRLGKVLLFKLTAQGVGYTVQAQVPCPTFPLFRLRTSLLVHDG